MRVICLFVLPHAMSQIIESLRRLFHVKNLDDSKLLETNPLFLECENILGWYLSVHACYQVIAVSSVHQFFETDEAYLVFCQCMSDTFLEVTIKGMKTNFPIHSNWFQETLARKISPSENNFYNLSYLPFQLLALLDKNESRSLGDCSQTGIDFELPVPSLIATNHDFHHIIGNYLSTGDKINWGIVFGISWHTRHFSFQSKLTLLFTVPVDWWQRVFHSSMQLPKSISSKHNYRSIVNYFKSEKDINSFWIFVMRIGTIKMTFFYDCRVFEHKPMQRWCIFLFPVDYDLSAFTEMNVKQRKLFESILEQERCWIFYSFWNFYSVWLKLCQLWSRLTNTRKSINEQGVQIYQIFNPFS